MAKHHSLMIVVGLLAAIAGCRTEQLRYDQDQMRQAVLDLYTNQIMDNLIRAYCGMPMVQIDYTSLRRSGMR